MTTDELKKEAEEYTNKLLEDWELYDPEALQEAYLAGSEPREKRIAELEQENAELKLKLEALEGQTPWKDIKDKSEVVGQLTKAKELLLELYDCIPSSMADYCRKTLQKVALFFKDSEVEK